MRNFILSVAFLAPSAAFAQTATVYYDTGYSASSAALTALGITHTAYDGDGAAFLADSAAADIIVVEVPGNYWPADVGTAVGDALAAGKLVSVAHWAYDFDATSAALLPALGVATPTVYDFLPSDLYTTGTPVDFFASLGGVLAGGQDLAGYNNTYMTLAGAGDYAATNLGGEGAILVTNGGTTIVNGWLPWDWQNTDLNFNGKPDGQDVMEAEFSYLLGMGPLTLTMNGSCPGPVQVSITNGTPGGQFGVVRSNGAGSFVIPTGGCAGTTLGLSGSRIRLLASPSFDGMGAMYATPTLSGCGKYYQIVDLTTCAISGVVMK